MKQFKEVKPRVFVVRSAQEDPTQKQSITFASFSWVKDESGEHQRVAMTKGVDAKDVLALALTVLENDSKENPTPQVDDESVRQALINAQAEGTSEVEDEEPLADVAKAEKEMEAANDKFDEPDEFEEDEEDED